jgi:tRNA pseudouridine32 synthase / 23S rRNA pseudouridine746 synthase
VAIAPQPSFVTLPRVEEAPALLDFFDRRFPRVGREVWRQRLASGKVLGGDGVPVGLATPYRAGERLAYFREVREEPVVPFAEEVLLVTEHFLVADKPHFLPTIPAGPYVAESLLYRLRRATGERQLAPVHRLDRETAGLVLFSLRPATRRLYHALFARREVDKEYLAVAAVPTAPPQRQWRLASRIVRGEPWFRMREAAGEPNAASRIELLDWRQGRGLFRLHPETGKRHQLRLHLARLGYPIVGERYYPDLTPEAPPDFDHPLQLLALRLAFRDPVAGEAVAVESRRRLAWPPRA